MIGVIIEAYIMIGVPISLAAIVYHDKSDFFIPYIKFIALWPLVIIGVVR